MTEIHNLDGEWVQLIKEARDLGMTKEQVRAFLQSIMDGKRKMGIVEAMSVDVSFT